MKTLALVLALLLPGIALADPSECSKLAAFKANQQNKLSLSRYGLGLITAAQLKEQQDANRAEMLAEWEACKAEK